MTDAERSKDEASWGWLIGLSLAALAVRLGYDLWVHPVSKYLFSDMAVAYNTAQGFADPQHVLSRLDVIKPRGLALVGGYVLTWFGTHGLLAWGILNALASAACVPLVWIGARRFLGARVATVAAALLTLDFLAIGFSGYLMSETYLMFCFALALACLHPAWPLRCLLAGLALGAGGVFKTQALPVSVIWVLLLALWDVPELLRRPRAERPGWRAWLLSRPRMSAALLAAGVLTVQLHESYVTSRAVGSPALIAPYGGHMFYLGHCGVKGMVMNGPDGVWFGSGQSNAIELDEKWPVVSLNVSVLDSNYFWREGWKCVTRSWSHTLVWEVRQLFDILAGLPGATLDPWPLHDDFPTTTRIYNCLIAYLMAPFALWGLWKRRRQLGVWLAAGGPMAAMWGIAALVLGNPRFRVPYDLFLLTGAAVGLTAAWESTAAFWEATWEKRGAEPLPALAPATSASALPRWVPWLAVAAIPLVQLPFLVDWTAGLNSDHAVPYLMARHILFQGERPLFFWGNRYMGAVEAYLGAALMKLLHADPIWILDLVPLAAYVATAAILVRRRERGDRLALAFLLLLPPPALFLAIDRTGFSQGALLWLGWAAFIAIGPGLSPESLRLPAFGRALAAGIVLALTCFYIRTGLIAGIALALLLPLAIAADARDRLPRLGVRALARVAQLAMALALGVAGCLTTRLVHVGHDMDFEPSLPDLGRFQVLVTALLQFSPWSRLGSALGGLYDFYGGLPLLADAGSAWPATATVGTLALAAVLGFVCYRGVARICRRAFDCLARRSSPVPFESLAWVLVGAGLLLAFMTSGNVADFGSARFLAPLLLPILLAAAEGVRGLDRPRTLALGAVWLVAVLAGEVRTLGIDRSVQRNVEQAVRYAETRPLDAAVGDYWLAYLIDARWRERLIVEPESFSRYQRYAEHVAESRHLAAFELTHGDWRSPHLVGPAAATRRVFGEVTVGFYDQTPAPLVPPINGHLTDPEEELSAEDKAAVEDELGRLMDDTHLDVAGLISDLPENRVAAQGRAFCQEWNIGGGWDNYVFFAFPETGRVRIVQSSEHPELSAAAAAQLAAADAPDAPWRQRIERLTEAARELIIPGLPLPGLDGHMTDPSHRLSDEGKTAVEGLLDDIGADTHVDVAGWISYAPENQVVALGSAAYRRWNIGRDSQWQTGLFFVFPVTGRVRIIQDPDKPALSTEESERLAAADDPKADPQKRIERLVDAAWELLLRKS